MYRPSSIALLSLSATILSFTAAFAVPTDLPSSKSSPTASPSPSASPLAAPSAEARRLVDQISAEERAVAESLWSDAMEKFATRDFKGAILLFTEYLNRFPGTAEAVDARAYLGQSHLFSKDPASAIAPLQSVVEVRGKTLLGNEARTHLGQAYLDSSRFTEAYLVSEELLSQETIGATLRAKALLLRAHAQAGLKQNLESEKTLVAFQAIAESDPELERETAHSFLVSLLLKANHCDALPTKKTLPEDQAIDQVSRKGICVLEMGTLLVRAAKKLSGEELVSGAETVLASLRGYQSVCLAPPISKKRGKAAAAELSKKLSEGCRSAEKLLAEAFRDRENLKPYLEKLQPTPLVSKLKAAPNATHRRRN